MILEWDMKRYGVGSVGLRLVDTDVSEKHNVSIFGAEDRDSMFLRNVGM
jgi:hypothetical protein